MGRHFFFVKTDQWSLICILEQREIGSEYQLRVIKLIGFDFEILYQREASNKVTDALSRWEIHGGELDVHVLIRLNGIDWSLLQDQIKSTLAKNEDGKIGFSLIDNKLFF